MARETTRELRTANRTVGRQVAKVGKAAIAKGAPRMFGQKLAVRTKVDARPDGASVTFQGKPAGGWAIQETGAKPHEIRPRRAKALTIDAAGTRCTPTIPAPAATRPGRRPAPGYADAVDPAIEDVYDDALGA